MTFTGLPLGTLLTIAAIAGALTVVFYILKLRRRPIAVPFARIWDSVFQDSEATQLFSRLKRLLSLLLQLALLALLIFALGDPRSKTAFSEGRHLVVLIDASASMKAIDVKPSRVEVAKSEAKKLVRSLGGSDRALIVQMGTVPTPLSTMSGEVTELEPAIDRVRASDTRADLEQALRFALDSLRGLPKPEIVLVSDGAFGDTSELKERVQLSDVVLTLLPVGKSGINAAITEFSVRRYPLDKSRSEVMLEVTNTNDKPAQVELTLLGDGIVIDVSRFKLGANERLPRFYKDLAGASRTLEASLRLADGRQDDLPADDHAYALMPERRRARVLVVTTGNTYLEAALLLDEYLDVTLVAPEKYPPKEGYDVAIFDGVAFELPSTINSALYLNPPKAGSPVPHERAIEGFGFDTWDKKSGILRFLAMADIQVAHGFTFKPGQGDKVIGASDYGPILVSGSRAGHRFAALGFDPRNSDFVLRVAWPLFVLNTINFFIEEDTSYISSFRTGDVWQVPVPSSVETATLIEPSGGERVVPVKEGRAVYLGEQAGFYKLTAAAAGDVVNQEFAANLSNLEESRIAPQHKLDLGRAKVASTSEFRPSVRRELWIYFLLGVIAISVVEWITYHRRVTV